MPQSKKRRKRVAENLRQVERVRRKLHKEEEREREKENELPCERKLLISKTPVVQIKDEKLEQERPAVKQSEEPESEEEGAGANGEGSWFAINWGGIYNGLVQVFLEQ